jgi:N-acetylmuramoyl-L-alanine amidase
MTATPVNTIRTIARSYEALVHAYPRSGYADNALWQSAGLMQLAFERSGSVSDLQNARRLLNWLKREYPKASLAKQVNARLLALKIGPKPAARPVTATAAAPVTKRSAPIAETPAPPPATPVEPAIVDIPEVAPAKAPAAVTLAAEPRAPEPAADAVPALWAPAVPTRVEALAPLPMPISAPPAPSETAVPVRSITHTALPKGDRITIELGREATYSTNRTANPDRIEIDLNDAALGANLSDRTRSISGALVKSLSAKREGRQTARVIIELNGKPRFSTFPLYNPFRLVIDVESDAVPTALKTTPPPAPTSAPATTIDDPLPAPATPSSTSRGDYSLARQLGLGVARIVIDPGHGGHDPGAGANGVNEADVVLDVALRVEALLKAQPGFDVVLTRRTNVFIPLEERTAIANRGSADMFLSIHVNASPRAATRGIETYLLDFASNPDAEALAARENATSGQTMRELPEIVKAITMNNKEDESRELARMVQSSLVGRMTPLSRGLKDLGVKRAPFVVLIGAQMPSVLAEISFVTNRTDASLMKQANHRQRIAQALADAVLKYRTSLKTPASKTSRTTAALQ